MSESETDTEPDSENQPNNQSDSSTSQTIPENPTEETTQAPDENFTAAIEVNVLETTLSNVSALVEECKMHVTDDGLSIIAVDPANVGMVDLFLEDAAFKTYNPNNGVMGVNLTQLDDLVSMGESDDLVHLTYDHKTRKLSVQIDNLEANLALIDPDSIREEPDIPTLEHNAEAVMESSDLKRGITASDMVSDHLTLTFRDGEEGPAFNMEAEGDTDDVDLTLDEDDLIALEPGNGAKALFSLDYLKDMNKAVPKNAALKLTLGDDMPVELSFDYAENFGHVKYILAPRIQND